MSNVFDANKSVLITGASAGIGLELARAIAPHIDAIVLVARRRDRLAQLQSELVQQHPSLQVVVEECDLADPASLEDLLVRVSNRGIHVDVLVNNAGLGQNSLFEATDWALVERITSVNVRAVLRLTHHFLAPMLKRRHGAILNVGSGAGRAFMPNAAVYSASKHFVRAFSDVLRAELEGTGVHVSEAAPGPVDSEFDAVAGIDHGATGGQGVFRISAQECAMEIVREFSKGASVIFPGRAYRWLMRVQPLMPRRAMLGQVARAARQRRR